MSPQCNKCGRGLVTVLWPQRQGFGWAMLPGRAGQTKLTLLEPLTYDSRPRAAGPARGRLFWGSCP